MGFLIREWVRGGNTAQPKSPHVIIGYHWPVKAAWLEIV